jgi:hypothetical protein
MAAFVEDFLAEGPDMVAANIAERAGVGGVSLAAAYHDSRDVFPHDPVHRIRFSEPGTVLFRPDPRRYATSGLQPRVARVSRERDAFRDSCDAARGRDLEVTAWTVFLHTDRGRELVDLAPENAFGDRFLTDLCPARPQVRDYAVALAGDVASTGVTTVDAESLHHAPFDHGGHHERSFVPLGETTRFLLALCFCKPCQDRAGADGVDGERVRDAVRTAVDTAMAGGSELPMDRAAVAGLAAGEMAGYLRARTATVTDLVAEVAGKVADEGAGLSFCDLSGAVKGYATGSPEGDGAAASSWTLGVDVPALAAAGTTIGVLGYTNDPARLRLDLDGYQRLLGGRPFGLTLRPMLPDAGSAADLRQKVAVANEFEVSQLSFYHYGLAPLTALDWIREALGSIGPVDAHD